LAARRLFFGWLRRRQSAADESSLAQLADP